MKDSVAAIVAEHVARLPVRSFVAGKDIACPRGAVDTALSRIGVAGGLLRVRKGLYWKGVETRLGMSPPKVYDVALVVGGPGSGPAGVAAAHWLGLTTQLPSTLSIAVPIRAPKPWPAVRFTERSLGRRMRELRPCEVALLEVLRAGPSVIDTGWEDVAAVACDLADEGKIRPDLIADQISEEHHIATRERWSDLAPALSERTVPVGGPCR